jgi:putative peptide zinc metalloprotease protein
MSNPEASPIWYRVANIKAKLRDHVRVHRHHYRGKLWYVLQDEISHRHYRFGPKAYQLIRELDHHRTVQEIWEHVAAGAGEAPPTQDEVVRLLADLHANDLIQCDITPDTGELFSRHEKAQRSKWKKYIKGPLLIRIPLSDPNDLLARLSKVTKPLFSRLGFIVWVAVVILAGTLAASYWSDIGDYWDTRVLAPYNLLLLVLTYPVVKGLHELAHGLAVKRWGGEVHELGIMLLVFMPLPYVDASSSSVFRDKRKRMLVGAAGILTELFLAAIATFVWFTVETGTVRDIAYDVMLIGGISTLLFNGNPLLRFDGYYVLADAVEIPNLGQRANRYYGYLVQKYLFGVTEARTPVSAPGERPWFLFYGVTSTIYRLFIIVTIVAFLAEEFLVVGVLLGFAAVLLQIVYPIAKQVRFVLSSPVLRNRRLRAVVTLTGLISFVVAVLVYVPLPASTYAQGVIWLPEHAQVRTKADGFIAQVVARPQTNIPTDSTLFELDDPLLQVEVKSLEWELRALRARFNQKSIDDRAEARIIQGQIERVTADLAQAREKASELTVISPANGTFLVSGANHLTGRFARKGEILGYVTDLSNATVRAVVRQTDIALVREQTRAVKLRLADRPADTISASIEHQVPSATAKLPSKALGSLGGGLITVDPSDPEGTTATEDIFLVDIALPGDVGVERVGTRVHIRFEHDKEPLAGRLYRMIRQLLLSRFTV